MSQPEIKIEADILEQIKNRHPLHKWRVRSLGPTHLIVQLEYPSGKPLGRQIGGPVEDALALSDALIEELANANT